MTAIPRRPPPGPITADIFPACKGRIVGIDPGTRRVGWGVIEDRPRGPVALAFGCIAPRGDYAARLRGIYEELLGVLLNWKPSEVAIESVFYGKNIRTAIKIGEGRGVALLAAAMAGVPVFEYPPALVKKAVAGGGGASKARVAVMAGAVLGRPDLSRVPPDASDALAIALCHAHRRRTGLFATRRKTTWKSLFAKAGSRA
ncbi:MAG: crossover junction endodeoxyribonuclease RuvC [Planctomycetota bacterium]